jgi:hypothetical protein
MSIWLMTTPHARERIDTMVNHRRRPMVPGILNDSCELLGQH